LSQFTRVTDGQTDRQTDRILIAIPRLHYMQRGEKVRHDRTGKPSMLRWDQPMSCQVLSWRECFTPCKSAPCSHPETA